jgi:thiamine-monophosphate kinase
MREFDLLEHVYARSGGPDERVLIPPGDDMAMVRLGGRELLAAVDQVVDGRHVLLATTPIELVGRKAVARSLSDVAAMAARPVACLAAVTLPPDFGGERATALFDAMRQTALEHECPLVGGDIAFHALPAVPMVCSITVLAEPAAADRPVRRGGARVGDVVYVTGSLGGAVDAEGLGRHLTFQPRIREALELSQHLGEHLHAMIDISDGLGRDASHIAALSGARILLHAERIPCSPAIAAGDWRRAVSDGEDYELCFTAAPRANVPSTLGDVQVTAIGEVLASGPEGSPLVAVLDSGLVIDATDLGWEHGA